MNFMGKADSLKMVGMIEKCETTIIFVGMMNWLHPMVMYDTEGNVRKLLRSSLPYP